jgi:parallel beta-helix repeat protein
LTAVADIGNVSTTIDGSTQASGHDIIIEGANANADVSGLVLSSGNNVINDVTIQNFSNGGTATGIQILADGNIVSNSTFDKNVAPGIAAVGQVHILNSSDNITVTGNVITNSGGDGVRISPSPIIQSTLAMRRA